MHDVAALRRSLAGVRTKDLARLAGLSRPTIESIRDGITTNPGINTVAKIRAALKKLGAAPAPVHPRDEETRG